MTTLRYAALLVVPLIAASCGTASESDSTAVLAAAASAADTFDPAYLESEAGSFPALDDPSFVPAANATWLESDDVVMGIAAQSGEAQAYPVDQMAYHHVANIRLAGEPFVVTY